MTNLHTPPGILRTDALESINDEIGSACERVSRDRSEVSLIAVTKAFGVEALTSAYEAGLRLFGESRAQESAQKLPQFAGRKESVVHLIGHLQSNKVKLAVGLYDVIQSVDSLKLLRKIDGQARDAGKVMEVYLQANLTGDPDRFGFNAEEIPDLTKHIIEMSHVVIGGIMMVAPNTREEKILRKSFREARVIRDNLRNALPSCTALSMGMSGDFEFAIEEGATHIRVGRRLFGERDHFAS